MKHEYEYCFILRWIGRLILVQEIDYLLLMSNEDKSFRAKIQFSRPLDLAQEIDYLLLR